MGAVLCVNQDNPQEDVLCEAERVLGSYGVLVMPTDSVYGIGCAATPENPAHERIFSIKHRDRGQTLPWLVADVADLLRYGRDVPSWAKDLARDYWPGALTLPRCPRSIARRTALSPCACPTQISCASSCVGWVPWRLPVQTRMAQMRLRVARASRSASWQRLTLRSMRDLLPSASLVP